LSSIMTASDEQKLAAALDLLKRLPPSRTYTYLEVLAFPLRFALAALFPPPSSSSSRSPPWDPRTPDLALLFRLLPQCLLELVPEIAEDLLENVDQPLQVAKDKKNAKQYLLCDYNRDGDSYR